MNKWTRPFELSRASAGPAAGGPALHDHYYFAFLSYSHADSAEADWLHQQLERFRVPPAISGKLTANGVIPKRLTPIFRDRHDLAASDDLSEEIQIGLAASRALIVLCSPAAAKSKWVNAEIDAFKRLHPDGCIVAAVVGGEPLSGDIRGREQEECFPPALLQKYNRHGKPTGQKAEPLAADLREGKGGRRLGFLKIVAGILGVGLDDLVQRDHLRRQRRLALITIASIVGMLIAIALAVTAIRARDAARDERRQAESLIGYMLGDLKDKLEPIGRLDVLDGVGTRVLDYYKKQDTRSLSDQGLLQRSRALSLLAQVAYTRGNDDAATALYREAMAGTQEALDRSPDDPNKLFEHAQNVFWIGEIARKRGQLQPAEAAYGQYKALADRMVAIDPDNLRWRMEMAYANENLGITYFDERRFPESSRQFESAEPSMQSAASIDSGNATYQAELANLLGWLAESQRAEGHIQAAIAIRERQIGFLDQRLAGPESTNVRLREEQIPAHEGLGHLLASVGQLEPALAQLRTGASIADQLLMVEPTNAVWKRYAAATRLDLAKTLVAAGQDDEAAQVATVGCRLANAGQWRKLQTDCFTVQARLALNSGSSGEAAALASQGVRIARSGTGDPMSDPYLLAAAYRLLGDATKRAGDDAGAARAWEAGLAALPANTAERPQEMYEREQLLRRLGRDDQARPITERLAQIGYHSAM
jgi:tetratricopeptide (TPR) repeat protein